MKHLNTSLLLAGCICGAAAFAQAQPSPTHSAPSAVQANHMTTTEKIKQLQPATNPVELLQLLKTVHEQRLLLDPYFMENDNILRLFGDGTITEIDGLSGVNLNKKFTPSTANPFRFVIWIAGAKNPPRYGDLTLGNYKDALPFNHELIEQHLVPGVPGENTYDPLKPMTNEAREYLVSLPRPTHPKGYWVYSPRVRNNEYDISLRVELNRHAQGLKIDLIQKVK